MSHRKELIESNKEQLIALKFSHLVVAKSLDDQDLRLKPLGKPNSENYMKGIREFFLMEILGYYNWIKFIFVE